MCGIGGIYCFRAKTVTKSDASSLLMLFEGLQKRGEDSFGFYADDLLFKLPGSFSVIREQLRAMGGIEKLWIGRKHVLGHTRLATQGDPLSNENNHPFETDDFVFAHNGWVKGIEGSYDLISGDFIETDSYAIIAEIQYNTWEGLSEITAIAKALGYYYYSSAIACWIYSKVTDKLYLYTCGRNPLYYAKLNNCLWFASEKRFLAKKIRKKARKLRSMVIYEFDRDGSVRTKTVIPKKKKRLLKDYELFYDDYEWYLRELEFEEFLKGR